MALFGVLPFQKTPINVKIKPRTMELSDLNRQELNKINQKIENLENQIHEMTKTGLVWCDSDEVCKLLHVSKRTLNNYRVSGVIPFSKLGGRVYYRITDITEYLTNNINSKTKKS
jgi:hypothetical protein